MARAWKRIVLVLGVIGGLAAAAGGVRLFMIWNRTRDVLPEFTEVPAGARSPSSSFVGLTIGRATLADTQALLAVHALSCRDTSMRALMEQGRQDTQQRMADARAQGEDPDGVTGASRAGYYSKKERNPQVVLSCENVDLSILPDGARGKSTGTLLFIFDSKALPLRSIIVERKSMSQADSLAQWSQALARFSAALGEPTSLPTTMPHEDGDDATRIFERYRPITAQWRFADRRAELTVMNFGPAKGISIRETFEVPWPVRVELR